MENLPADRKVHSLSLFTRFAVPGVLCFLLLAFILFQVWAWIFERHILNEAKETRAKYISMLLGHALLPEDFRSVKKGSEWKAFGEKMAPLFSLPEVIRIKVYNREGDLIWTDSRELLEQTPPVTKNPDLLKALEGHIEAEISHLKNEEHRFERGRFHALMELYIPIFIEQKDKLDGVVEVYLNVDPLFITIRNSRWLIALTVAGGMGLLLIISIIGSGRVVALIHRQNQDLRRQEETQKLLKELSQDITSLDLASLLKKLMERVRETLKVDITDVMLLEKGISQIIGVAGAEMAVPQLTLGSRGGRANRIIETGKALAESDITRTGDHPSSGSIRYPGTRGYLGVPFLSKDGKVIGIIRALTYGPREFAQAEIDLLQLLANDAAIAIENSRLLQELTGKSQELEAANRRLNRLLREQSALREVFTQINLLDLGHLLHQLTEQARALLQVDHTQVRLVDASGTLQTMALAGAGAERFRTQVARSGTGRSSWVMENRRPLTIKDVSKDEIYGPGRLMREMGVKGFLCVPLIARNQRSIGVFQATSLKEREFTSEEIALAQELAAGAAVAIENARLFEKVQKKSQELEDAYKTKSAFLNTMAHELRTPLNVLIATLQLYNEGFYGELNEKQKKGFEPMERNVVNLLNLINGILDLARLEAKRVPLQIESFSLKEITDELESSFLPLAKEKGLELRFKLGDPTVMLKSDRLKIKSVLQNLLANAVKYTDKGEIEFRVATLADREGAPSEVEAISIEVQDTGIGIKEADLPHIFEAFYMAEGVNRRKYPGSGLGLSIVKRLLELLHGDIQAQSEWGKGSTFTATLPLVHRIESSFSN